MNTVEKALSNIQGEGMRGGGGRYIFLLGSANGSPAVGSGPDICPQCFCFLRIHTHITTRIISAALAPFSEMPQGQAGYQGNPDRRLS